MFIDLNKITEKGIIIDQIVSFNEEYLNNSAIKELKDVKVTGRIYYDITGEVIFSGTVVGQMKLVDALSGKLINYPFNLNLNEILQENKQNDENLQTIKQNGLDFMDVLWQNIVLEVPIRVTEEKELKPIKGEGWELRDENSKREDPRLECFRTLLDEGKE